MSRPTNNWILIGTENSFYAYMMWCAGLLIKKGWYSIGLMDIWC